MGARATLARPHTHISGGTLATREEVLDQVVGANARPYTTTMHVVAASSDTVRDGLVELWVDGTLVFSVHDVPMSAEAFDRWEFPTICVSVPQPQSEYFWDIVVWKP